MIQPIVTNPLQLTSKAQPATIADHQIIIDLKDTLAAHKEHCVGMAANMIGQNKHIIIAEIGAFPLIMVNPIITKHQEAYSTSEGCLSLSGERPTTRYQAITVKYQTEQFQPKTQQFTGFVAEIIQHEIDHCEGILI
ncbi:polypeptide deformylase family protein [Lentilactobacillus senioris DSM 24302 = JCM 17472]|uniref:Polypeptide deformylase family protein n=1 Tax=Lentilactobacillus senioris DSM 24302 = JCM 17472 TaxID=1423802 RepID=A0A0R2CQT6_9LACO|nr:peptide deformylase [Lentilactobacillus senioris]KRM94209.1 polypeptide deformylase family protein [Lentilactobacillus senioris DSM 24302 = JCM 17472]